MELLKFLFAVTPVFISKFARGLVAGIIPYIMTEQVQSLKRMTLNWNAQVRLPKSKTFSCGNTRDLFWSCPSIILQAH